MRSLRRHCAAIGILLLHASTATAEPDAAQKALATQLFDDAERLVTAERASEACPKYAESQRLDPQLGTLLHLGVCYIKIGKSASAWASFKDAADIAARRQDEREAIARQYIADLEPRLSRLTIEVAWAAPATLEVKKDGELLGKAAWGSPVPIDPGPHVITARSPGLKDWQMTIDVPAGAPTALVSIPQLEPLQAQPLPAAPPTSSMPVLLPLPTTGEATVPADRVSSSSQRTWGYVVGGVGIVGLGVGAAFGFAMNSAISDRKAANSCSATQSCTGADVSRIHDYTSDAKRDANIANVGLIAGGAALVGGAILVLTAPSTAPKSARVVDLQPWFGSKTAGLAMGGMW